MKPSLSIRAFLCLVAVVLSGTGWVCGAAGPSARGPANERAESAAAALSPISPGGAPSTILSFSSDARRAVPVLSFHVTNWAGPAQDGVIFVKHAGTSPVTRLSVLNLSPPFFFKGGAYPGVGGTCGSNLTGDCTLVLTFDPRQAVQADYVKSVERRRYLARIQFEYAAGAATYRSSNFTLVGYAPGLVDSLDLTGGNPVKYGPSLAGGLVTRSTTISLPDFGAVRNVHWLDKPDAPFFLKRDTVDPARVYRRTINSNDVGEFAIEFRPTRAGRFQQILRLGFDNGIREQVMPITLEGEAFLPTADNVLVIFNALSRDSVALKDYYLAHRPGFAAVNVLPVSVALDNRDASLEFIERSRYEKLVVAPIAQWLRAHPEKRIGYVVLLHGIPTMRRWRHEGDWVFDGLEYALMQDLAATPGYVGFRTYASATLRASPPLVTHLFTGSIESARAYVDKLKAMAARMPKASLILSSRDTGASGSTYYLDDFATPGTIGHRASAVGSEFRREIVLKTPTARIEYGPKTGPGIARPADVAGYFGWGYNGGRGKDYAVDRSIRFSGHSGWYIIETAESFNGRLTPWTHQGSFEKWFARDAFGGTRFSNTPVGAVAHVVEPSLAGINNAAYFWSWENGQTFADAAWFSAGARTKLLVIGDPLVRR